MERFGGDDMSGDLSGAAGGAVLRASYEDRDRVVEVLGAAAGDGRLTAEELDERVGAALTARTLGELALLTADLPAAEGVVEAEGVVRIRQQGASVVRGEGWVVPRRLEVDSEWGDVTLDFTRAVITHDTLLVDLDMRGGTLTLLTRPGVVVDTDGLELGYAEVRSKALAGPGVPTDLRVRISGRLSFGRVVTRHPRRRFLRRSPVT
ncbi:DUF1707 domain-containing protein [Streptomyces sp. NPDC047000]|uniref:DUF1707 SHOCT-like domain-containing protein n=1 Tax=Streptomyces sp. NPDC047000 TaxID=3155474 RepID=UPI0033E313E4